MDIVGTKPRGSQNAKMSAGSEYWMTDEELRGALAMMVRIGGDKPAKEEVDRKVDEAMKKDPRLWLLIMNCSTDDGFLKLLDGKGQRLVWMFARKFFKGCGQI